MGEGITDSNGRIPQLLGSGRAIEAGSYRLTFYVGDYFGDKAAFYSEITVQFLVLLHSARHPPLTRNVGNIALLALAAELGLVPAPLAATVADVYRDYRRLQHQIRLQGARLARVAPAAQAARRSGVGELWTHVFGAPWQAASDAPRRRPR